jgi:hypothetical protein
MSVFISVYIVCYLQVVVNNFFNRRARYYGAVVGCESQQVLGSRSCQVFLFWSQCLDALQHVFVQVQHEQLGQNLIWVQIQSFPSNCFENFGAGGETRTHGGFPTAYKTVAIAAMRLQHCFSYVEDNVLYFLKILIIFHYLLYF